MIEQTTEEQIRHLRWLLLVHSCIYYKFGDNVVSDHTWADWARELARLQELHPDLSQQVNLYEYFSEWDGSTGMDLPIDEDWVVDKALRCMARHGIDISVHVGKELNELLSRKYTVLTKEELDELLGNQDE